MITRNLHETPVMKNAHGIDAKNLYNTTHGVVTVITLKPGEALKPHITPVDVAFYVLEGRGVVRVGDEEREIVKDTLVESPKGGAHAWHNKSDELFRVMVIKVPRPTTKTVFVEG